MGSGAEEGSKSSQNFYEMGSLVPILVATCKEGFLIVKIHN